MKRLLLAILHLLRRRRVAVELVVDTRFHHYTDAGIAVDIDGHPLEVDEELQPVLPGLGWKGEAA